MRSVKHVYKIGNGPSSSHTVGPFNAAHIYKKRHPDADAFEVTLYGSLALTGKGHGTMAAIANAIPGIVIKTDTVTEDLPHPNTMLYKAFKNGTCIDSTRIMSIGGGAIKIENEPSDFDREFYAETCFRDFKIACEQAGKSLTEYIFDKEDEDFREHLRLIWHAMEDCVERGLVATGTLPGGLDLPRKANILYTKRCHNESSDITMERTLAAYAYAVSEENADEHIVVTAPTCGSCGIIPAVFYYMRHDRGFSEDEILNGLAVAALIGTIIQTNASVSGAECGCQAEIGSACSMAAAGLAALYELSIDQIECAAEIAMEHHLGLTCDPIKGLVQIPCIERNAVGAMRAVNAVNISRFLADTKDISLDEIITTMYKTGLDMDARYKETAHGGLAVIHDVYSRFNPTFAEELLREEKHD
ncbi:MAG: L-serine ammonia-lyase, iron-sulfur-dependent, subunit alpha [Lachnospiraceae bacterium]|nr:L-serine ammonia-lyase, iron-sulfur-dependent, subunit alpha [Lachnospiraceae bacterium]